ncbi:hypothetical protein BKA70DRAFT_1326318 [Coprinopsis sp. MPI-PUGE-AT-0042]|nr:hypothetical protein BKA70DRAFT_1326318 [Coprinopsis sp. MPI-PUGE-AT-0042]
MACTVVLIVIRCGSCMAPPRGCTNTPHSLSFVQGTYKPLRVACAPIVMVGNQVLSPVSPHPVEIEDDNDNENNIPNNALRDPSNLFELSDDIEHERELLKHPKQAQKHAKKRRVETDSDGNDEDVEMFAERLQAPPADKKMKETEEEKFPQHPDEPRVDSVAHLLDKLLNDDHADASPIAQHPDEPPVDSVACLLADLLGDDNADASPIGAPGLRPAKFGRLTFKFIDKHFRITRKTKSAGGSCAKLKDPNVDTSSTLYAHTRKIKPTDPPAVSDLFGNSNHAATIALVQIKEIVSTMAAAAPGLRQAAGGLLLVIETLGLFGHNAAASELACQSFDNYRLLSKCVEIIDDMSPHSARANDMLNEVTSEFAHVMRRITESVTALTGRRRGIIQRYINAKLEKQDLEKHRIAMAHIMNKFQITLQMISTVQKVQGGGAERVSRLERCFIKHQNFSPQTNITINAGDNATFSQVGNVNNTLKQSQVTDYSNRINTYYGDDRRGGYSASQRRRDTQHSYTMYDSDEDYYSPRRRRVERMRREQEEEDQIERSWSDSEDRRQFVDYERHYLERGYQDEGRW